MAVIASFFRINCMPCQSGPLKLLVCSDILPQNALGVYRHETIQGKRYGKEENHAEPDNHRINPCHEILELNDARCAASTRFSG